MIQNEIKNKKILFIVGPVTQDSGILKHILELAKELSKRGHRTGLITRLMGRESGEINASKEYFSQFSDYLEYFYIRFPNLGLGRSLPERVRNLSLIFRSFYDLKQSINRYQPDIIHTHALSSCFQVNMLQHRKTTAHITTLHQDLANKYRKYYTDTSKNNPYKHIISYVYSTIVSNSKRLITNGNFIAISDEMKKQIREEFDVKEEKIKLIHHGANPTRFRQVSANERARARDEFSIKYNSKVVCLIGSLEERKGHDILIKSLSILRADNIDITAVFAGTGNKEWKQKIENMALELNVSDLVKFVGFIDTFKVLSSADVLIAPSRYEAFPLVSIEAMLSGIVPIRTPTSGSQNQITEGVDGFIVPHEDSEALAGKMKLLLCDNFLREKMSANALKKAQEKFTTDRMIARTLLAYQDCMNSVTQKKSR